MIDKIKGIDNTACSDLQSERGTAENRRGGTGYKPAQAKVQNPYGLIRLIYTPVENLPVTVVRSPIFTEFGATFTQFGATFAQFGATFTQFGATFTQFGATFAQFGATFTQFGATFTQFGATFTQNVPAFSSVSPGVQCQFYEFLNPCLQSVNSCLKILSALKNQVFRSLLQHKTKPLQKR
jgi:hypothetical protein